MKIKNKKYREKTYLQPGSPTSRSVFIYTFCILFPLSPTILSLLLLLLPLFLRKPFSCLPPLQLPTTVIPAVVSAPSPVEVAAFSRPHLHLALATVPTTSGRNLSSNLLPFKLPLTLPYLLALSTQHLLLPTFSGSVIYNSSVTF